MAKRTFFFTIKKEQDKVFFMRFDTHSPLMVLFPLKTELTAFLAALTSQGHAANSTRLNTLSGVQNYFEIPSLNWVCCLGGHGKAQMALTTQFYIQTFAREFNKKVAAVICAGTAGALTRQVSLYDVVVGSETVEHDYKQNFLQKASPCFQGDQNLIQALQQTTFPDFNLFQGRIASGDEDVIDLGRAQQIYDQTSALAVAWEGAGAARACLFNRIPFLEVRGISDFADESMQTNFNKKTEIVMSHIATALLTLIK